jgi:hypothetical protein
MVGTTMEFIKAARRIAVSDQGPRIRGTNLIATALAEYFEQGLRDGSIPDYSGGGLESGFNLLNHLYEAWQFLSNDTSDKASLFREQYERQLQRQPVDLLELSGGANRFSDIGLLDEVIARVVELAWHTPRPEGKVSNYFLAADTVLNQYLRKFLRSVYMQGMNEMIADNQRVRMLGVFGSTLLTCLYVESKGVLDFRLYSMSGDHPVGSAELAFYIYDRSSCSLCLNLKSIACDLITGARMINEVIDTWPSTSDTNHDEKRRELFTLDLEITVQ